MTNSSGFLNVVVSVTGGVTMGGGVGVGLSPEPLATTKNNKYKK